MFVLNPAGSASDAGNITSVVGSPARRLLLGAGTATLTDTVRMLQNSCGIAGIARGATILQLRDSYTGSDADGILVKNTSDCDIRDLTISAQSARTEGAGIRVVGGNPSLPLDTYPLMTNDVVIENVAIDSQFNGIVFENDTVNDYRTHRAHVRGGWIRNISADGTGIWINTAPGTALFGGSQVISGVAIEPSTELALANIRITGTGGCHVVGGYEVYGAHPVGCKYAMLIDPPSGGFLTSVIVEGGFLDRSRDACLRIAPDAAVAKFGSITFNGVWFAGCTLGDVLQIVGAAAKYITFVGCGFYSAEAAGKWCGVIDAASYVDFIGCNFAGATAGGLKFTNGASNFKVLGCTFSAAGVGTGATTLPIAVQIDDDCDNYIVTNNNWTDAAITSKIQNQAGAAITPTATKIIQDNIA